MNLWQVDEPVIQVRWLCCDWAGERYHVWRWWPVSPVDELSWTAQSCDSFQFSAGRHAATAGTVHGNHSVSLLRPRNIAVILSVSLSVSMPYVSRRTYLKNQIPKLSNFFAFLDCIRGLVFFWLFCNLLRIPLLWFAAGQSNTNRSYIQCYSLVTTACTMLCSGFMCNCWKPCNYCSVVQIACSNCTWNHGISKASGTSTWQQCVIKSTCITLLYLLLYSCVNFFANF